MTDIKINSTTGKEIILPASTVEDFKSKLLGTLLQSGDTGYDEARALWNSMIDKRPSLIARCTGTADVINCVNFARENNLSVCVKSGGHNIAGLPSAAFLPGLRSPVAGKTKI